MGMVPLMNNALVEGVFTLGCVLVRTAPRSTDRGGACQLSGAFLSVEQGERFCQLGAQPTDTLILRRARAGRGGGRGGGGGAHEPLGAGLDLSSVGGGLPVLRRGLLHGHELHGALQRRHQRDAALLRAEPVPPPSLRHSYPDPNSGLAEFCLRFATPIPDAELSRSEPQIA
jgi:hypothetical protein